MKAVTLVETLDGTQLERTSIPLDNAAFFESHRSSDGARPEQAATEVQAAGSAGIAPVGPFYYALDQEYEIPYGSTWMLYAEVEDVNGLVYRCIVDRETISGSGEPADSPWGSEATIFDAAGNALYVPDPSLYQ